MTRIAIVLAIAAGLAWSEAQAQWIRYPAPGTPRTADGKADLNAPVPRTPDGRPDVSGVWQRIVPPELRSRAVGPTDQNLRLLLPPGESVPFQRSEEPSCRERG